jgi:hypothetical protein
MEIWRIIKADPRYEVSNFGRVRSYCRFNGPHVLKAANASHGYPTVVLGRALGSKLIHVLVAEAFIGPKPFPSAEVLHRDGNKSNGRWDNLDWGTRSKNLQDKKWQGAEWKLTGEQATEIKRRRETETGVSLAGEFGVSESLVSAMKHGLVHADA